MSTGQRFLRVARAALTAYRRLKRRESALDFQDLLVQAHTCSATAGKYANRSSGVAAIYSSMSSRIRIPSRWIWSSSFAAAA